MISETNIDDSFSTRQFLIDGYTAPYRLDRNSVGGGIFVYVREGISSKLISVNFQNREGFFLEINLRKRKWIIGFSYNLHASSISHVSPISLPITRKNFLLVGDFNAEESNNPVKDFGDVCGFKHLIK